MVETIDECYGVLGAVHSNFEPIDSRFKDYIAKPKENGYRSIHTTVLLNGETPVEVQIRTYEMHQDAEYGVCAHFLYKEKKNKFSKLDEKLLWLKNLVESGENLSDEDILNEIHRDMYFNEIYVYTPLGKIVKLEEGATPLDFAYAIHSAVGDKCVGCKINGKISTIDTVLENNDIVEIITSANKGPSRDWLKIAKQSGTKAKIRAYFKREMKDENIKKGRQMLELTAKSKNANLKDLLAGENLNETLYKLSFKSVDDMLASVGYGGVTSTQIINRLLSADAQGKIGTLEVVTAKIVNNEQQVKQKKKSEIIVAGMDNLPLRFASCCHPIPGDEIVGFFSRGRGVMIHRTDCPNLKALEEERLSPATWGKVENAAFPIPFKVLVSNLNSAIVTISTKLNNLKINLQGISTTVLHGLSYVMLTVTLSKDMSVQEFISKMKGIKGVLDCERYRI